MSYIILAYGITALTFLVYFSLQLFTWQQLTDAERVLQESLDAAEKLKSSSHTSLN